MKIVKLAKRGDTLYFTGVDSKGIIHVGLLPVNQVGKKKAEWFKTCLK